MTASLPANYTAALDNASAAEAAGAPLAAAAHYAAASHALPAEAAEAAFELQARRAAALHLAGDYAAEEGALSEMSQLAGRQPARQIEVEVRQAELLIARGEVGPAAALAEAALTRAVLQADRAAQARCLAALAEATHLLGDYAAAEAQARAALDHYSAVGDAVAAGHCLRRLGLVALSVSRAGEAATYLAAALERSRALGDRLGEARALNALGIAAADYAEARAHYEQALAISTALGDREGQATQGNNLAVVYCTLGLYRQARAFAEQAADSLRQIGALHLLAVTLETLGRAQEGLGDLAAAQACFGEGLAIALATHTRFAAACCLLGLGRATLAGDDHARAIAFCREAAEQFSELGAPGEEAAALAWLGAAHLRAGALGPAREHTAHAAALLDAGHVGSEFPPQNIWWWRYQALVAGPLDQLAPGGYNHPASCLAHARAAMELGVATLSDAGLRRNYLCRVPINRAIVEAAQGLPGPPPPPLMAGRDALQGQLTRMLVVAARLNEQRDPGRLREQLLDEAVELCGAERLLLVGHAEAAEAEPLLSRGVSPLELIAARVGAAPYIELARAQRRPVLAQRDAPEGPPGPLATRSIAAVPLISAGRVLGVLYADLRLAFGALDQSDLDLLGLLGAQAATALENARLYADLEGRVARRTAELEAANRALSASMAEAERARSAAESASAAKSAFLASMSHELRTPLNAVLGFAQLMARDGGLGPAQRERLAIIARSGEHLLDLINHALEMAKIEAGRLMLANATFDLRRLIDGVAELFVLRAAARQVALKLEIDPDLPHYVSGDAARLRQILINLISNAVKFTHRGAVSVRAAGERAGVTLRLRIDVTDTGEGIAADELAALFQPFVQTASGRQAQEGTGLGLAISREFARLMGGDITVVSRPGLGSTFTCVVGLGVATSTPAPQPRLVTLATRGARWRALVADDVPENRRLLAELLGEAGFEVREASDGAQAVTLCAEWRPHLVLMDLRMPGTDGHAATSQIKRTPAGRSTVVIAVTAGVFGQERDQAIASGCDELITKPVRHDELLALIARQLGLRLIELDPAGPRPAPD